MTEPEETSTSPERFILFTDAVAAIAITLLILPLLESLGDLEKGAEIDHLVREHLAGVGAFLLGFAVILRFWWGHNRVFQHLSRLNAPIVFWSSLWTLAIVVLPIQTAIITDLSPTSGTVLLYCGNLVLASGSLCLLSLYAYRHPRLSEGRKPVPREELLGSVLVLIALVLALIIGSVFPRINYWGLTLMFLTGPAERLIRARWRRAAAVA